jgi:hypothetical protein
MQLKPAPGSRRSDLRVPHGAAIIVHLLVPKMSQALTLLATIGRDHAAMQTLAVISILALLAISGAAISDELLTSNHVAAQETVLGTVHAVN